MRAFPVPSGGLYFPNYFIDGSDAYLDTSLNWWTGVTSQGESLPSQYCAFDSSGTLHCVVAEGVSLTHMVSTDGGNNWINQTYDLSDKATELEEWEFHSNGVHDLFVLNVRYQSSDGPDIDISWHVRGYSDSLLPDTWTSLGLGISTPQVGLEMTFVSISPPWASFLMVAQ